MPRAAVRGGGSGFWRGVLALFGVGLVGCLAMFFGSKQFASMMGYPGADLAIMALAPTMFLYL